MCSVFFAIAESLSIKIQLKKQNGFPEINSSGFALIGPLPRSPRLPERKASPSMIRWDLLFITDYSVIDAGDFNVCDLIRQGPLWNVIMAITVLNGCWIFN
jgi:hypothetical protein